MNDEVLYFTVVAPSHSTPAKVTELKPVCSEEILNPFTKEFDPPSILFIEQKAPKSVTS